MISQYVKYTVGLIGELRDFNKTQTMDQVQKTTQRIKPVQDGVRGRDFIMTAMNLQVS
jgi:hypothetical protein